MSVAVTAQMCVCSFRALESAGDCNVHVKLIFYSSSEGVQFITVVTFIDDVDSLDTSCGSRE